MTTAIITKLRSGGAVFELGSMPPHWFPHWREAVREAEDRQMGHVLLEPPAARPVVEVLASTS